MWERSALSEVGLLLRYDIILFALAEWRDYLVVTSLTITTTSGDIFLAISLLFPGCDIYILYSVFATDVAFTEPESDTICQEARALLFPHKVSPLYLKLKVVTREPFGPMCLSVRAVLRTSAAKIGCKSVKCSIQNHNICRGKILVLRQCLRRSEEDPISVRMTSLLALIPSRDPVWLSCLPPPSPHTIWRSQ